MAKKSGNFRDDVIEMSHENYMKIQADLKKREKAQKKANQKKGAK